MMQTKYNIGDKVINKVGNELTIAKVEITNNDIKYYFEERTDKYYLTEEQLKEEKFYKVIRKGIFRPLDERYGIAYCRIKAKNTDTEIDNFMELSQELIHDIMERTRKQETEKAELRDEIRLLKGETAPAGMMEYFFGPDNYFYDAVCGQ